MKRNFFLLLLSISLAFLSVEIALWVFWSNPYAGSGADKILKLRMHHKNMNKNRFVKGVEP